MNRKLFWPTLAAAVGVLAACSSGDSPPPAAAPPPPLATTMVSGAVVDDFVISSTVTAYQPPFSQTPLTCIPATPATTPSSCATATTDGNGNYTLNLGNYSGAVLLQATGGSYTDTVTGQVVTMPASLTLSALLPSVSPGSTAITAQITPETTMIAQLALQQAAQGTDLATAVTNNSTAVQGFFGGLTNIGGIILLDLSKTDCATAANQSAAATQASYDASLLLAGVSELASQNGVTAAALWQAVFPNLQYAGAFDGNGPAGSITVPLANGSGTVSLATIYGSNFAQSLLASISTFESSIANVCQATLSAATSSSLSGQTSERIATNATVNMSVDIGGMPAGYANNVAALTFQFNLTQSAQGNFGGATSVEADPIEVNPSNSHYDIPLPLAYTNNDLDGTWTVTGRNLPGTGVTCFVPSQAVIQFQMTGSSIGPVTFGCSINPVTPSSVSATVIPNAQLAANTSVTVQLSDTTAQTTASLTATSASPTLSFGNIPSGDAIVMTIEPPTQPTSGTQSCNFDGALIGGNVVTPATGLTFSTTVSGSITISVACSTTGGTGPGGPATAINGPGGMAFDSNGNLWVTNGGGNSVLEFSISRDSANNAMSLTQINSITTGLSNPGRLAFDVAGNLYVTNSGTTNSVTIYETADSSLTQIGTITDPDVQRPLGVAVDTTTPAASETGYVYVANNSTNSVTVFSPPTGTLSAGNNKFTKVKTLAGDGANPSNSFSAPGVLSFFATPPAIEIAYELTQQDNFLFVGLGPSSGADSVLMYDDLPLTSASTPFFDLSNGNNCSTGPSGPTAVAVNYDVSVAAQAHPVLFYVASYYTNTIAAFDVANVFENPHNACPTPYATISTNVAQPEGLAVDAFRNVFVSDSSASQITVYYPEATTPSTYHFKFSYTGN